MTTIGDALRKAGIQSDEKNINSDDKIKITIETKIGYMKKHVDNIQRLVDKYFRIQGDVQEEADVISALNNHFIYMVEAFKDILNGIIMKECGNGLNSLREAVRYFNSIVETLSVKSLDAALETLIDRNDVAHKYEVYEAISQKTLRNCISYVSDYRQICKVIYDYCKTNGFINGNPDGAE